MNIDFNNELGAVVFDEVHYINDHDRGQTWEKTILKLPPHVQMVMLSATIDKPERFAHWVMQKNEEKDVYLASTNKRVVPLTHYMYIDSPTALIKSIKDNDKKDCFIAIFAHLFVSSHKIKLKCQNC